MPEISRFYGIIIAMFSNDHNPPHFHAKFGDSEALYDIETQKRLKGVMPITQQKLIEAWALFHKAELMKNFETLQSEIATFTKIKPL
ncbi:MAG: DUF4160 domain-containing protein [Ignavibacteriae bacterium]|jgi:hypothetical protein|nr:DUF4160 domain-containing protein [Ignavibacteriota bacterium]